MKTWHLIVLALFLTMAVIIYQQYKIIGLESNLKRSIELNEACAEHISKINKNRKEIYDLAVDVADKLKACREERMR